MNILLLLNKAEELNDFVFVEGNLCRLQRALIRNLMIKGPQSFFRDRKVD